MRRLALCVLAAACLCVSSPAYCWMMSEEYGKGRIYPEARSFPLPKDITDLMNFPGRVYGFHWFFGDAGITEELFFEGGPKMFTKFLEQYSKLKIKSFKLYIHMGPPPKIWDMSKTVDKHYDWQYTRHLPTKLEEPETVFVQVWTGGDIDLSKVRIPANIEVVKDKPAGQSESGKAQ